MSQPSDHKSRRRECDKLFILQGEVMAKARKKQLRRQVFLNTVAGGRSVSKYGNGKKVFSQGDLGDAEAHSRSHAGDLDAGEL